MADRQAYLPKVMDGAARQRSYVARQKATNLEAYRAKKAAAEKARRRRRRAEKQEQRPERKQDENTAKKPLSDLASVVAELLGPGERVREAEASRQTEREVYRRVMFQKCERQERNDEAQREN